MKPQIYPWWLGILLLFLFLGRCARAGRQGWAISLVSKDETCYMLDIHLFLSRPLALAPCGGTASDPKLLGSVPRHLLEDLTDEIINWETTSSDLVSLFFIYVSCDLGFFYCISCIQLQIFFVCTPLNA